MKNYRGWLLQHGTLYNNPTREWKNPEEQEPGVPGEKGKLLRLSPSCYTDSGPLLTLPDYPDCRNPLTNPLSTRQGTKLSQGNTVI